MVYMCVICDFVFRGLMYTDSQFVLSCVYLPSMEKLVLYGATPIIFIFYFLHSIVRTEHYYSMVYPFFYCLTGLFISPSGTSELDCATTKKDRAERSILIGRESLKVFFCTRGLGVLAGSTARV